MKDGSGAIKTHEPCQVGDQAALSESFNVPPELLSGADVAMNASIVKYDLAVYGLILCSVVSLNEIIRIINYASGVIQKMASCLL